MTDTKQFLQSSAGYVAAQVVGLLVSLVSFPILTRALSVSDYGILGVCNTSLLIGTAVAKLGLPNAIVRYYYQCKRENDLHAYYATFWWGSTLPALVILLLLIPACALWAPAGYAFPFALVAVAVFGMVGFSTLTNFLRAEERNGESAVVVTVSRVLTTAGGVSAVIFWGCGIGGIFAAQAVVAVALAGYYTWQYRRRFSLRLAQFSWPLFREALSFGAPLIAFELSSVCLSFSDRFLITYFCGTEQLGLYTAGYNMCFYLSDIVRQPLGVAVLPIYLRIYAERGSAETARFIREILVYVLLLICPLFAGVCALNEDLLTLFASSKYQAAATVVPWVLGSTLLYACQPLLSAGFTIVKRTGLASSIIVTGAVLNMVLNMLLLPRFGMIAAAWATAACYLGVLLAMSLLSYKSLPVRFPLGQGLLYGAASVVMYLVVRSAGSLSLPFRIALGMGVYCLLVVVVDRQLAQKVQCVLKGLVKKRCPAPTA